MKKKELIEMIDREFSDDDEILFCDPGWGDYTVTHSPIFSKKMSWAVGDKVVDGFVVFGDYSVNHK